MRKQTINFVWTSAVTTPARLAGNIGDVRGLYPEDAQILKGQGYGYIESEGPPEKPEPPVMEEDIEITNARNAERLEPPIIEEAGEIVAARNAPEIEPEPIEEAGEIKAVRKKRKKK